MRKVFILGNFGYHLNNLNGQTMRTRTIYDTLMKYLSKDKYFINYTDTSFGVSQIQKASNYLKGLFNWITSSIVILLPAQKAIKYVLPIFYYMNIIFKKEIHFIAIGGWLSGFLEKNIQYKKYFRRVNFIYVQTESLKKSLEQQGLENVVYFPNFRVYKNTDIQIHEVKRITKIVFFSRVMEEKGIELAVNALKEINKNLGVEIELHIYGPIVENYKGKFEILLDGMPTTHYKGVLEPDEILSTLSQYDLMVFPTYYSGEGFPGTLLDALSAGVPVIASDWKYNSEIINDGYTGLIFRNKDKQDLTKKIKKLISRPDLVNNMKKNCLVEAEKYTEENVASILYNRLNL